MVDTLKGAPIVKEFSYLRDELPIVRTDLLVSRTDMIKLEYYLFQFTYSVY